MILTFRTASPLLTPEVPVLPAQRNRTKTYVFRFALARAAPALFFLPPFALLNAGKPNGQLFIRPGCWRVISPINGNGTRCADFAEGREN